MANDYLDKARQLLDLEARALLNLEQKINGDFGRIVEVLYQIKGKVVVAGVGKSGLVGRKIAATFASTGTPSFFIHGYEAGHGDIGALGVNDALMLISNSGETDELINMLPAARKLGIPVIGLLGNPNSTLAKKCDFVLDVSVPSEADPLNLVPTSSSIVALAMGDALAIALLTKRDFQAIDFANFHPGGQLGRRLLTTVEDLMHTGDAIPFVQEESRMPEALFMMTKKGLGIVGVLNSQEELVGVITDGDLRRGLERTNDFLNRTSKEIMSRNPKWITTDSLAIDALHKMEEHAITNLFVYRNQKVGRPIGIIHIHDILKYGIMP
jgi:arabinose-5-phosphate isomerase